jgi:hypothetical protein
LRQIGCGHEPGWEINHTTKSELHNHRGTKTMTGEILYSTIGVLIGLHFTLIGFRVIGNRHPQKKMLRILGPVVLLIGIVRTIELIIRNYS